jgi:hypothetical protein
MMTTRRNRPLDSFGVLGCQEIREIRRLSSLFALGQHQIRIDIDCFRLERQAPDGICTRWKTVPCRAHASAPCTSIQIKSTLTLRKKIDAGAEVF